MVEVLMALDNVTAGGSGATSEHGSGISLDDFMWIYISPAILLLGIFSNSLVLAIMRRRRNTTGVYLTALAVADSIALALRIIPQWCRITGTVDVAQLSRWTCKMDK